MNLKNRVDLFLDSGAFSSWSQGITVDLDAYIAFALEHIEHLEVVANLDVIPGKPYQKLTQADIDHSSEQGWKNYRKMLAAGIPKEKLVHVFHQGEDFKWLVRMVKSIPYIGLSPANDKTTAQKTAWLDKCMPYVTDAKGLPLVKFHGFAVTSLRLMLRYPWYSVDSTSWVMTGRLGGIYVPRFRKGEWIYGEDSWKVSVSSKSPNLKDVGKHIATVPKMERGIILDYCRSKGFVLGKSEFKTVQNAQDYELAEGEKWASGKKKDQVREVEIIVESGLCNNYKLRDQINIMYFLDLEKHLPEWPWSFKTKRSGFGF